MIRKELFNPSSIAVIGASNQRSKPGGNLIQNLLKSPFVGKLYAVNPKGESIQGLPTFTSVDELPPTELAVLCIAAQYCPAAVKQLCEKGTRAFVIVSAGFSEMGVHGEKISKEIENTLLQYNATLIGPNCIGIHTKAYSSLFTTPSPKFYADGCDLITGSGAVAVFISEYGIKHGLRFANIISVGNSIQTSVEDCIAYLDDNYVEGKSAKVKLLYFESIREPQVLLKHAQSLLKKGCILFAIKAGRSESGQRAAMSHTGAMLSNDKAVEALFEKAGIIRCNSRKQLVEMASVLQNKALTQKSLAIITHAGGPGVMLTDTLSNYGVEVPELSGSVADELLKKLKPGSSISNPIDILATGNAEELAEILDTCEHHFDTIGGIVVIFGSPGLFSVDDVYQVIASKQAEFEKPIYPIFPSVLNAEAEMQEFSKRGIPFFTDEVSFGEALGNSLNVPCFNNDLVDENFDDTNLNEMISKYDDGVLSTEDGQNLLEKAGMPVAKTYLLNDEAEINHLVDKLDFPWVMKVDGIIHKSDVGGVIMNIQDAEEAFQAYSKLISIKNVSAVAVQQMLDGLELFLGSKYEDGYGQLVVFGLGGIFVEAMNDVCTVLAPISKKEALCKLESLKSYSILQGSRGQEGIDIDVFTELISTFSKFISSCKQIKEVDMNPIIAKRESYHVVDVRIMLEK